MEKGRIIERIGKLFALADASRNPSESEVFEALSQARTLMAKYEISENDLMVREDGKKSDSRWNFAREIVPTKNAKNVKEWEFLLADAIGRITHTIALKYSRLCEHGNYLTFEGEEVDCGIAVALFQILSKQALRFSEELFITKIERRSYLEGFAIGVGQQAKQKVKSLSDVQSRQFALVSTEKEEWIREKVGKTKESKYKSRPSDPLAQYIGIKDGLEAQTSYNEKALN